MAGQQRCWLLLAAVLAVIAGSAVGETDGTFLVFSDIHLDPFYGTRHAMSPECRGADEPFGVLGCDSPLALVNDTLRAARAAYPNPDFIIFNGDLARHEMAALPDPKAALTNIIGNVSTLFDLYFPNVTRFGSPAVEAHGQLLVTLGNNDVVPGYALELTSSGASNSTNTTVDMLKLLADDWAHELTTAEYATLAFGGYFAREVVPGLHVLSINTILYSSHHAPNTSSAVDPNFQFAWLRGQLEHVRGLGHRAYIVGHIPPALSSGACVRACLCVRVCVSMCVCI
jgi:3',5'-cyclic AMP phosphodiesterase CpdA